MHALCQDAGDAKRARVTSDPGTARKELLGSFQPSDLFQGARPGYVFKNGLKGLGYYEDANVHELEGRAREKAEEERRAAQAERRAAAAENPEEIELDMDLDDDEPAAPPPPVARASNFNPEEIELNFEDIEQASVPSEVFGGSLAKVRDAVAAEETPVEEPPMADEEPAQDTGRQRGGALAKFMKKGKGKGKGG